MTFLVVGATGATGRLLAELLLARGHHVRVIVRSRDRLPEYVQNHAHAEIVEASLLDMSDQQLRECVSGCDAVASCLGHNLTFKGIFGHPRRLVTEAVGRLSHAIQQNSPKDRVKFVLMNTAGNQNRDLNEPATFANRCVIGLIRWCVPPHADNEQASEVLRQEIGLKSEAIEWVVVRPDSLVNDHLELTPYDLYPSPIRDPIFNAGTTSRLNVADFMAELITDQEVWAAWVGQMPVIYDRVAT